MLVLLKLPSHEVNAYLMIFEFLFVLLINRSYPFVQGQVLMNGLFISPLPCFMELGCDTLMSGMSHIGLPQTFSYMGRETFLDLL